MSQQFGMNKHFLNTVLKAFLSVWAADFSNVCFLRILQQVNLSSAFFLNVKNRFPILLPTVSHLPNLLICKRSKMVTQHLNLLEVLNVLCCHMPIIFLKYLIS